VQRSAARFVAGE